MTTIFQCIDSTCISYLATDRAASRSWDNFSMSFPHDGINSLLFSTPMRRQLPEKSLRLLRTAKWLPGFGGCSPSSDKDLLMPEPLRLPQSQLPSPRPPGQGVWKFVRLLSRLTFWRITLNKANLGDLIAASRLTDRNWIKIVKVFSPCDLKNYRAPLLYYVKLCASFQLLSGNAQFRSKSSIFYPVWPWNLMDDLEKQ